MNEVSSGSYSYSKTRIDDLMKRMLQDYVDMILKRFSPEQTFADIVIRILDKELSFPNPKRPYIDMKLKMDFHGKEAYTPKSLDVTAATCLLIFQSEALGIPKGQPAPIKSALHSLRDDRNELAHSTANESEYEIFEWGVITLGHMTRFLWEVCKCSLFSEEARDRFKHGYRNLIKQEKARLEGSYRSHLYREKEMQESADLLEYVLSNENPSLAFSEIAIEFIKPSSPRYDPGKYFDWVRRAADGGIDSAQSMLGNWYYSGAALAGVEKDWNEALEWYEKVDRVDPSVKVRIASLYANGISQEHSVEEGQELIESYKSIWNIETVKLEDGAIEHHWAPKSRVNK